MSGKAADTGRRDFLKLAGLAPAAAATAAIAPQGAAAETAETASDGLRRTEHVEKYLETARF